MANAAPQNFANHAMFRPLFHFVAAPILVANFVSAAWGLKHGIGWVSMLSVLVAAALIIVWMYSRVMALSVQDRVIRLEERLRMSHLLPANLKPRIEEFTIEQLVGLRFASDAELPALAERVLSEGITDRDAIKRSVVNWRADHARA